MPRLNEHHTHEGITTLLFGGSGTGKTFLAGSAGDRTLIVAPSNGIATLKSPLFKQMVGSNPFLEVVDEAPIVDVATGFDKIEEVIDTYLRTKRDEIDTIVVEDATSFRRMSMNKALELNMKLNRSKTQLATKAHEIVIPTVQDFGTEINLTEAFIIKYTQICKSLNLNFVMTAHERLAFVQPVNSEGKTVIGAKSVLYSCKPGFTGQTFPDSVTGLFDNIWHTEVGGSADRTFYRIRTQGDSITTAKTRTAGIFPVLIEKFVPLSKLHDHVRNSTVFKN